MNILFSQKGALFGLDARLGMLVFTALSMIAGYYGFGRIAVARDAAIFRDINAFEEALGAYQTDTGTFFLFSIERPYYDDYETADKDLTALWDKSRVKSNFHHLWNGPYLHRDTLNHKAYGQFGLIYGQEDREENCTDTSSCFLWLTLTDVPQKIWQKVNLFADESGGKKLEDTKTKHLIGKIQSSSLTTKTVTLYIRTINRELN